jgi:hypothetical protein
MNRIKAMLRDFNSKRRLQRADQIAEMLFGRCVPSQLAEKLRARHHPVEAVKVQIAPLVVAHCLAIENVGRSAQSDGDLTFFHAMSDRTKALLAASGIELLSPRQAFPDDALRRAAVGSFLGPDVVDSHVPVIPPGQLFGMMLSLEMFILPEQLRGVSFTYDARFRSIVRRRIEQLTGISPSTEAPSSLEQPFADLCAIIAAISLELKP